MSYPAKMKQNLAKQFAKNSDLNWGWYNPPEDSIPVEFCLETSLHGLKYMGQQKRHIFERFFWLAAFLASTIAATILIWGIWNDYQDMPIITVFSPTETTLDDVPFPSVTVCSVNKLQKSTFNKIHSDGILKPVLSEMSEKEKLTALAKVVDVDFICYSNPSFIDRFVENGTLIKAGRAIKEYIGKTMNDFVKYLDPTATLRNVSQPCGKMILSCLWHDTVRNCSDLFREIETDYGHCCSFNTLPISLLLKNHKDARDDPKMVEMWENASLDYENLMFTKETRSREVPYRQRYPGRQAGLSFALDPGLSEYHCTNTDSEGFLMNINVPLDKPKMVDKAIAISTHSEVFVGIRPEVAMSDEAIKSFSLEKRKCYYGNEYDLPHYTKYTTSNCLDECIADRLFKMCGCVRYFMPRNRRIIGNGITTACPECLPTCTEIDYQKEITVLPLQTEKVKAYLDHYKEIKAPKMSIVHVYFNVDSVYPKLRKQVTTLTQLLSNAGGLLGLFMGFSVLSLLEIFYYGTMRFCCNRYRDKIIREHRKTTTNEASSFGIGVDNQNQISTKQSWFFNVFNGFSVLGISENSDHQSLTKKINNGKSHLDGYRGDLFTIRHKRDNIPIYLKDSFEPDF